MTPLFGLYLRKLSRQRHGTPKQLAKKWKDHGLTIAAIAGPWHDTKGQRYINKPDVCRAYAEAMLEAQIAEVLVWGYPWRGSYPAFAEQMNACMVDSVRPLIDAELGVNPTRRTRVLPVVEKECATLVTSLKINRRRPPWLSTYGRIPRWFPLKGFYGCESGGGQHYTSVREKDLEAWNDWARVIPNNALYVREGEKARPMTPAELNAHLSLFVASEVRMAGLIGWAENFVTPPLWRELARWAEMLERGACVLNA